MNKARLEERKEEHYEKYKEAAETAFQYWSEVKHPTGPDDQSGDNFDKWVKEQIPEFLEEVKVLLLKQEY